MEERIIKDINDLLTQLFQKMHEAGYEWDAEKKELKKIEDEKYNGEDYGIDSLYHAQRILEKTLGSVEGYQSDDGILEHKCAISAVKKLYEQKPTVWSEEDDNCLSTIISEFSKCSGKSVSKDEWMRCNDFLNSLKDRVQPKQEWSQNDIDMIDWLIRCCEKEHEGLCNDKYGHQDIVSDLKRDCRKKWDWLESLKNRVAPQKQWKPSDEQIYSLDRVLRFYGKGTAIYDSVKDLIEQLMKLREE